MKSDRPVLAFDTSTSLGTIAIARGDALLAEVTIGVNARHAESLLPAVDFAVSHAGLERTDLSALIVGAGPGSFTGVRIAGATAKGMARALDIPLYALSSLTMVAAGAGSAGPVCALFDARRGEVYAACHRFGENPFLGSMDTLLPPSARPLEWVIEELRDHQPLYVGEGAVRYARELSALGARVGPELLGVPRASALIRLFRFGHSGGRIADPGAWTPAYLRAPGATIPAPKRARVVHK